MSDEDLQLELRSLERKLFFLKRNQEIEDNLKSLSQLKQKVLDIIDREYPEQPHQLTLNAHEVIVDLVNALESVLVINPHHTDFDLAEKALEQGKQFLGIKDVDRETD